ncbi:MAG: hypothetical protein IIV90_02260 [Oscillospiraceae bacterium]|nr:hypothetical protein [Oscillospiraceae bacterium]
MGMELQQSQRQTQQLMLTQAMRQSLHVLQLPLLELRVAFQLMALLCPRRVKVLM